jgi:hypothetical protein
MSLPSMSEKIKQRGMELWPTWGSLEPLGSCTVHPLYTAGPSSVTSSGLPTSAVPVETHCIMVSSWYCFHASSKMESSSH